MKKITAAAFALVSAAALSCAAFAPSVSAADSIDVYVTINAPTGNWVIPAQTKVTVTDYDNDGKLTITDALKITHENYCIDGAAGFETAEGQYGPMVTKCWGIENG